MHLSDEVEVVSTTTKDSIPKTLRMISATVHKNVTYEDLMLSFSKLSLTAEPFSRVSPVPILTRLEASLSSKDLNDKVPLSCGCHPILVKLLLLVGLQGLQGKEVLCPVHKWWHDLSDSKYFRTRAVSFVQSLLSEC